jgi:hypothetical protein
MNTEALFIFLILLLGLVLCSFLGGNCGKEGLTGNFTGNFNISNNGDMSNSGASTGSGNRYDNYNHYTGSSTQLSGGSIFYGQRGTTATVVTNNDGTQSLQIILPGSSTPVTFSPSDTTDASSSSVESYINFFGSATTYYGPNGAKATVINNSNGQQSIMVTTSSGVYYYNVSGTQSTTDTSTQYYGSTGYTVQQAPYTLAYQGPNGGSAGAVTGPQGNSAYYAQGPDGNTVTGTSTNNNYNSSAGSVTGPQGNTAYYAQGPAGNTVAGVSTNNTDYSSSLPQGIPRSQIPSGQEDLYILKSEIVPPVCPACPVSSTYPRQEKCPPCPACARCPEPSFECKKVPNYNSINNDYLPAPVLNNFSTFGM